MYTFSFKRSLSRCGRRAAASLIGAALLTGAFIPAQAQKSSDSGSNLSIRTARSSQTAKTADTTTMPAPSFGVDWLSGLTGSGRYLFQHSIIEERLKAITCPQRTTSGCMKVVVKPGDALYGGERAELLGMSTSNGGKINETLSSGTKYFALSVFIPSDWTPPAYNSGGYRWGIVMQLHGPDDLKASPSFAFTADNEFGVDLQGGDITIRSNYNKHYAFSNGSMPRNAWVDFVVGISFASTPTGSVTVWRHDQGASSFSKVLSLTNIATLQYGADQILGEHYWKTGFYRSVSPTTTMLYLGPQARANTAAEAAAFAFKNVAELKGMNWNLMFP